MSTFISINKSKCGLDCIDKLKGADATHIFSTDTAPRSRKRTSQFIVIA